MKPKFPWWRILIAIVLSLGTGVAAAYTYHVWRDDLSTFRAPSYNTIVPTDDPRRNTPGSYGGCNFSPNNCGEQIGTIPEPSTCAMMLPFLFIMFRKCKNV